ncbi:MAG: hypothetical protein IKZ41_01440, partial [Clostridia bacterium]|nr:hypothetical protein [Clostridia bacterium]
MILKNNKKHRETREKSRALPVILFLAAVLLLAGIVYYVTLPAINIHSGGFWTYVIFLLILALV